MSQLCISGKCFSWVFLLIYLVITMASLGAYKGALNKMYYYFCHYDLTIYILHHPILLTVLIIKQTEVKVCSTPKDFLTVQWVCFTQPHDKGHISLFPSFYSQKTKNKNKKTKKKLNSFVSFQGYTVIFVRE